MPRQMPDFAAELADRISIAAQLPATFEQLKARALPGSVEHRLLHVKRIEAAYEMAFLRVFIAWEDALEQSFIRYLSGCSNSVSPATPAPTIVFSKTIALAELQLYGGNQYLLWHNPTQVITRSKKFFALGKHEQIFQSNLARLVAFASIRHRIAHGQDDSRNKFDLATMLLVGKRYHGGRPGPFLRDFDTSVAPARRWIDSIASEFVSLIRQITP